MYPFYLDVPNRTVLFSFYSHALKWQEHHRKTNSDHELNMQNVSQTFSLVLIPCFLSFILLGSSLKWNHLNIHMYLCLPELQTRQLNFSEYLAKIYNCSFLAVKLVILLILASCGWWHNQKEFKAQIQINRKTANKHGAWSAVPEVRKGAAEKRRRRVY